MWAEPLVDLSSFFSVTELLDTFPRCVSLFLEQTSFQCCFHVPGQDVLRNECGLDLAAHWARQERHSPWIVSRHIGKTIRTTLYAHMSALGVCDQAAPALNMFISHKAQDDLLIQVPSMPPTFSALIFIDRATRASASVAKILPRVMPTR